MLSSLVSKIDINHPKTFHRLYVLGVAIMVQRSGINAVYSAEH